MRRPCGSGRAREEARTGCMRFAYQPRNSLYAGLSVSSQYRYPISSSANGNPATRYADFKSLDTFQKFVSGFFMREH
ncbi:hypothetical protein D3C75_1194930 [compost metagenome]